MPEPYSSPSDSVESFAAQWLARRDRGLSASEQAAFQQWRRVDPRHEAAVSRLEKSWALLDQLAERRPAAGSRPNPDLLAPRRLGLSRRVWMPFLAAAAAAVIIFYASPTSDPKLASTTTTTPKTSGQAIVHPGPQRQVLEDGSIVELNASARIEVQFTAAERHVRLVSGEAFFTVAKNPHRPFIVSADRVAVRAVGTAFSVGLGREEVSVLVTEGKVGVGEISLAAGPSAPRELSALVAGQQGVVHLGATATTPLEIKVTDLAPPQIERALAWEGVRLEFVDLSLADVVAEFNRYNDKKLVVGDTATAAIKVGGTFRADNVDAFVRLLDAGFGVSAVTQDNRVILRKTHGP